MVHSNVINLILQDLLRSNDYTITGVATYSNVPEEVIYDIAIGNNNNPSLEVSRKIIELHRNARVDLYQKSNAEKLLLGIWRRGKCCVTFCHVNNTWQKVSLCCHASKTLMNITPSHTIALYLANRLLRYRFDFDSAFLHKLATVWVVGH